MQSFIVKRDGARDIKFSGELIAEVSSTSNNASSSYSGSTGRWTELALYRSQAGKFICQSIGRTQWDGEHDRHSGAICADMNCVMEFFGHGWLAKELYESADLDTAEDADSIPNRKAYCYRTQFSDGRPDFWNVICAGSEQDAHDKIIAELQGVDLLNFGCDENPGIAELHELASDPATIAESLTA